MIKIYRLAAGGRATDEADLPSEVTPTRYGIWTVRRQAARHGVSVGAYADALLATPLPWTKLRTVYRLLGLVKKFGADRVDAACARVLECEAVDVALVARIANALPSRIRPNRRAR